MMKKILTLILAIVLLLGVTAGCPTTSYAAGEIFYNNVYDVVVSSSDGICNMRSGPGKNYDVIGEIRNGSPLQITALTKNTIDDLVWGQTTYNGTSGWISVRLTTVKDIGTAAWAAYDVTVTQQDYIVLRKGPGTEYDELYHPRNGQVLRIDRTMVNSFDGRPWGRTVINGMQGWVSLNWTSRNDPAVYNKSKDVAFYNNHYTAVISSPAGNQFLRSGAGMANGVMFPIQNGSTVYVTAVLDNGSDGLVFGQISYGGYEGWIVMNETTIPDMKYACMAQYYVTVQNSKNIALRKGPGTEYDLLAGNIPNGKSLYITETVINSFDGRPWGKTQLNGMTGWVSLNWTTRPSGDVLGYTKIPDYVYSEPEMQSEAKPAAQTATQPETKPAAQPETQQDAPVQSGIITFSLGEVIAGKSADIDGLGTLTFTDFDYQDSVLTRDDNGDSTHSAGDDAEFACLYLDITNPGNESKDYASDVQVLADHAGANKYGGWFYPVDNSAGSPVFVTNSAGSGSFDVKPSDTGHYVAGVTLPKEVIRGDQALTLKIRIGETKIAVELKN